MSGRDTPSNLGWEEIRDWFTKPRKGRGWREKPAQKRRGESGGQADEMAGRPLKWQDLDASGWYRERAASPVIWEIKATIPCGWPCPQPKSILTIKAALAIKPGKEERGGGEVAQPA